MSEKVKVAIYCITYNHKDYIRQALDGFVMQKTNFPFIAVIGDDASDDGTTEIIKEYAQKYPDIIKPIIQPKNTQGWENCFDTMNACKAEYVAVCEGDDYWIDEYKLQKQVDFMDKHKNCTVCFHPVRVIFEGLDNKDAIFPTPQYCNFKTKFTLKDLLNKNFIQTNSVMYRWMFNEVAVEPYYPCKIAPGDWYLHLLHAKNGDICMLPDIMSIYRRHPKGIWWDGIKNPKLLELRYGIFMVNFFYLVYKNITDCQEKYYKKMFLPSLKRALITYFEYYKFDEIKILRELYPKETEELKGTLIENFHKKKHCELFLIIIAYLLFIFIFVIS